MSNLANIVNYSIVIPLKDEEENIAELIEELEPVMEKLALPWELICIDDGSQDQTRVLLKELAKSKPYLKLIFFDRNYGQSSAFQAGFNISKGTYVITLDGDRQNDPQDIPKLIALALATKADLVCGIRTNRQDPWGKRWISKCANAIRRWICEDGVSDTGCSLKVFRKECFKEIPLFNGMHRFFPALFTMHHFRVTETPVNHRKRKKGKTKYTVFNRSFNTIADLLAVRWMKKRSLHYQIEFQNE